MKEVLFSGAAQLAAAIRAGHTSASEVLEAHLAQIERHNPALNAVVTLDAERAHEQARLADAALARGDACGPLHGVPFTLKDAHATAGMRTTTGFPPFADHVPDEDSPVVARLKAAGGILIGKTNVPTMLADFQTSNPIFGRTNNPWDLSRTPGGSSGGAAAALAAGMTPFEIGTDLSGSIRIPAQFCGLFGLKPTEHRVSLVGLIPGLPPIRSVRVMSCVGPLARSAEDLALIYRIIAGPDGHDTDLAPVPVEQPLTRAIAGLRVAIAPTFPGIPAASDIRNTISELGRLLARAGADVEQAAVPELDYTQELASAGQLIQMMTGAFDEEGPPATLAQYFAALHRRDQSIHAWEQFFQSWDFLVCPASMTTAFAHCEPGSSLLVDGQEQSYWMVSAHSTLFNYTGHPAAVLPFALDREGLPIGVQVVARHWDEARLLAVAEAISEIAGGFQRPPGY
jgi:amidase